MAQSSKLTPLMQQYFDIREKYDDALLLFQVGDFYELFFDDAKTVASFLGITLTKRGKCKGQEVPLCGFPVHALDHYVPKLVKGGFKVALCQQLEEATAGKMVQRGVTQVFTPGTLTSDNLLDAKKSSYLFSFFPTQEGWGLVFSELLTSQLHVTMIPAGQEKTLEAELYRFLPDEVILLAKRGMGKYHDFFKQRGFFASQFKTPFEQGQLDHVKSWCKRQFGEQAFDRLYKSSCLSSAVALWHMYLAKNQEGAVDQFKEINFYEPDEFLLLDAATQKNLEIVKNSSDGTSRNTLFRLVDRAMTAMGSRMISSWLLRPLIDGSEILKRQDAVQLFVENPQALEHVRSMLDQIGDMQRVVGRIALKKASLHDYLRLKHIVALVPDVANFLSVCQTELLQEISKTCVNYSTLHDFLDRACNDDENQKWMIKTKFDAKLDRLRDLVENSSQQILKLEQEEQQRTGISSLKIRQNNVHGFYIEVTKANVHLVPDDYQRQQTLVGRERYTMPALKQLQSEMMQAQFSIGSLEKELFEKVKAEVEPFVLALRQTAQAFAILDALAGMSSLAYESGYVRPLFNDQQDIEIVQGRHPVVAHHLQSGFIANDTQLTDEQSLWIITGPNMGGKSTYLRQVALICLLAQTGSFVPASQASLPILDRIFTRIGAGDNLAEGKSTFLVEMEETAQICLQATEKSLVILDEVGRGTSTFDGLAIAQAVVEYMHQAVKARCLFATHYHELTQLQEQYPGIASYYANSKKTEDGIVFLHKIIKGVADGSFGIEVAKLARLPKPLIARAQSVLHLLQQHEKGHNAQLSFLPAQSLQKDEGWEEKYEHMQQQYKKLLAKIKQVDIDDLSPRQALDFVYNLQKDI